MVNTHGKVKLTETTAWYFPKTEASLEWIPYLTTLSVDSCHAIPMNLNDALIATYVQKPEHPPSQNPRFTVPGTARVGSGWPRKKSSAEVANLDQTVGVVLSLGKPTHCGCVTLAKHLQFW